MVMKFTSHILGLVRIPCLILLLNLSISFCFANLDAFSASIEEFRKIETMSLLLLFFQNYRIHSFWGVHGKEFVLFMTCSNLPENWFDSF